VDQRDNSKGILIAALVTGSGLVALAAMALTGVFERLGLFPAIIFCMVEFMTIGIVWFLVVTGRLGGQRPKE